MEGSDKFQVGCRVRDADGYRATVRYIGPVAAAKNKTELWLGVEWDLGTSRGKHDGSCVDDNGNLVRYFTCAFGAGSFVKPGKVTFGRSLSEALLERYVALDAPPIAAGDAKLPDAFVTTSKGNQKSIEFVGEKKIRQRQQLSAINKVSIRNDVVSCIGSDLNSIAGHMIEIDLQDNLLWEWKELGLLGKEVPMLQTLLLHGNRMQRLTADILNDLPLGCFNQLKVLALNSCGIMLWEDIQRLEAHLPCLEELYLANNDFPDLPRDQAELDYQAATGNVRELPPAVLGFSSLRILDLSYCKLEEWSQVQAFGNLQALQELILDGNCFSQVVPPSPETFKELTRLSLSSTKLAAWSNIDTLASFSCLQVLRLTNIPLFSGKGASEVRPLVIARMPQLRVFNASVVSSREREDAEKVYLRLILREKEGLMTEKSEEEAVRGLNIFHPRFKALFESFGQDVAPSTQTATNSTLASEIVSITFRNLSFGSNGTLEPILKKIPRSTTIEKVRLMVKQLFGLDPRLQQLSLRIYKDAVPTLLDDDKSTLGYYGAIDGASIYINEDKA